MDFEVNVQSAGGDVQFLILSSILDRNRANHKHSLLKTIDFSRRAPMGHVLGCSLGLKSEVAILPLHSPKKATCLACSREHFD